MKWRTFPACVSCRLLRGILHLSGKGGTALPGKLAMAISPEVLYETSRGMRTVLVTGTNGKTTTCRMLENALASGGQKCLSNRSGANLLSGITAEFACNALARGKHRRTVAVIECDEGALKLVAPRVRPAVIVVTNLFRDQLDRYGEVMNTRKELLAGIAASPDSILCLNADCPLTSTLAKLVPNPVYYYGIEASAGREESRELSDAKHCVECGAELEYSYHTYAHLGGYRCPVCGAARPAPHAAVREILEIREDCSIVRLAAAGKLYTVKVGLPAVYNLYNALAAVSAGLALRVPPEALFRGIEGVKAPFGRMEAFRLNGILLQMILVKNPAGCNQAMEFICGAGEDYGIVFCLNDRTADGHDISWIWDADFEKVVRDPHNRRIWVSGTRAEDMRLRLKYAGAAENRIHMEKDYERLIRRLQKSPCRIFVLPNYTSMLDFRRALAGVTGKEAFWKG